MSNRLSASEKQKILAVLQIKLDDEMKLKDAFNEVSFEFNMSPQTIKTLHYRNLLKKKTHGDVIGNWLFSRKQEELMLGVILAADAANEPMNRGDFIAYASAFYKRLNGKSVTPSKGWLTNFVKRHSALIKYKKTHSLCATRADEGNLEKTAAFVEFMESFQKSHHYTPSSVINVDESRVVLDEAGGTGHRLVAANKPSATKANKRDGKFCSVVPFVSAAGEVIVCFVVISDDTKKDEITLPIRSSKSRKTPFPVYYLVTPNGYTREEHFPPVLKFFERHFHTRYP